MTWLKIGQEYSIELAAYKLSDAAYRTHTEGLNYALDRETDGLLLAGDIRRFAESKKRWHAVQELVDHGLWARESDDSWRIIHHMEHQPPAEKVRVGRQKAAVRSRRSAAKKALMKEGYSEEQAEALLNAEAAESVTSQGEQGREQGREYQRESERSGTALNGKTLEPPVFKAKEPGKSTRAEPRDPLEWPPDGTGLSNRKLLSDWGLDELEPKALIEAYMEKSGVDRREALRFCGPAFPARSW